MTNAPACAGLAGYPQGSVTVTVRGVAGSGLVSVYVQGSPELKGTFVSPGSASQVTFDQVADLGPGVAQPVVAIYGGYRYPGDTAPDVQAGQTAAAVWVGANRVDGLGTGKLSWRSDGSELGYAMRGYGALYRIALDRSAGAIGQLLPALANTTQSLVDWAPAAGRHDQFLYAVPYDGLLDGVRGIYLASTAQAGEGTQLVSAAGMYAQLEYDAQAGPYACVRHPQYVAFVAIMLGFVLQWPTLPTLVMFPVLVTMYVRLARREEREALAAFGERYAAVTPAFVPRLSRLLAALRSPDPEGQPTS